jgi:RND family efflux transporter MFP subunit
MHPLSAQSNDQPLRWSLAGRIAALVLTLHWGNPLSAAELATETVNPTASNAALMLEGRVEAVRAATIAAQVAGRVLALPYDAGQAVKAGAVVARIDAREQAGNEAARQAQLAQARAEWERSKRLFAQKFISQSALDQAELAYKAALATAQASGASLSHATISAPLSGIVGERLIEVGEMAVPGRSLLTVFDPSALRVVSNLPASMARKELAPEAEIEIGGNSIKATRVEILPTVDGNSQTAALRLYLPMGVKDVRPGMAVRVRWAAGKDDGISVPTQALVRRGEVTAVYVLAADGRPRLRQVRLGEVLGAGRIRIEAGLAPGERVVLDPVKAAIAVTAAAKP